MWSCERSSRSYEYIEKKNNYSFQPYHFQIPSGAPVSTLSSLSNQLLIASGDTALARLMGRCCGLCMLSWELHCFRKCLHQSHPGIPCWNGLADPRRWLCLRGPSSIQIQFPAKLAVSLRALLPPQVTGLSMLLPQFGNVFLKCGCKVWWQEHRTSLLQLIYHPLLPDCLKGARS